MKLGVQPFNFEHSSVRFNNKQMRLQQGKICCKIPVSTSSWDQIGDRLINQTNPACRCTKLNSLLIDKLTNYTFQFNQSYNSLCLIFKHQKNWQIFSHYVLQRSNFLPNIYYAIELISQQTKLRQIDVFTPYGFHIDRWIY